MDRRRITATFSESDDLQDSDTGIERDGEHVTDLNPMTGRFLARPVDPNMPLRDQSRSIRTGPDDPRMPQPSIDSLTFQSRN